jgi:hypothetical protein
MADEKVTVVTNAMFMKNEAFVKACENVNLKVTKRQASKWRMNKGKAFKEGKVTNNG